MGVKCARGDGEVVCVIEDDCSVQGGGDEVRGELGRGVIMMVQCLSAAATVS